jgi:hypothetical protein
MIGLQDVTGKTAIPRPGILACQSWVAAGGSSPACGEYARSVVQHHRA